jgi:hypothetical protein
MRSTRTPAGIALVLALGLPAHAQQPPFQATVVVPEAEVRSGPSSQYYPTNKLSRGDTVQVVGDRADGWLAIQPPPGSFSWINIRFLKQENANTWLVVTDPDVRVPVRVGSQLRNAPPTVEGVKLTRGTLVVSMGEPETAADGSWLPIVPPLGEVRYLRAEAVRNGSVVQAASSPTTVAVPAPPPARAPAPPTPQAPARTDPLWLQAERAEQTGNIKEAEELYTRCAEQTPDYDLRLACFNRLTSLYRLQQVQRNVVQPQVRLTNAYAVNAGTERQLPANPAPAPTPAGPAPAPPAQASSQYGSAPAASVRPANPPGLPPQPALRASGPGWLRRTSFFVDNKRAYALQSDQGQLLLYVTGGTGIDLEPFVGKAVDLYGPLGYRGDLRTNYMTATQVVLLR